MAIQKIDQRTGIANVLQVDRDMIKNLFNVYTVPGEQGSTEGLLQAWQDFMAFYLNNPRDLFSGLNVGGSSGDVYKVRIDANDLEGYLPDKLKSEALSGIKITVNGSSNKVMQLSLEIQESSSSSIHSFLKDAKTIKKPVAGTGIIITSDDNEITFSATDEKLKTSATDNSNGYLENKLIAGTNTTVTKYTDVNGNEALQVNATDNLPEIEAGDAGKKIVVKQDEMGYELVAASTTSGFNDKDAQVLSFDDLTRTLSITPVNTSFDITNSLGVVYTKTTESIVIPDVNGLSGVFYNDLGNLEVFTNENRSQLYNRFLISTCVSFISWSVSSQENNFVTKVLKDRTMSNSTFAKNAFDEEIYRLTGLDSYDVVLNGNGDLDEHAEFGITAGSALWTDDEHNMLVKDTGSNYKVYYKDGTETRFIEKTGFSCLNGGDFTASVNDLIVFNNNGSPTEVANNDFVWYIIGITNDIEEGRKIVSFMGQNEYATSGIANNNRDEEIANIEQSFGLKQEFSSLYAVLWQTGTGKSNVVHGSIEDFVLIDKTGTNYSTGGGSVPDDLINGSDASYLHNHDSLYGSEIENIITVGKADTIDSDVDFNTITDALASVQPLATPTIVVYKGVYDENLTFKPNVPIVGIGNQGDVIINGEHLVNEGNCYLSNLTLTDTTNIDNTSVLRITSDGNLFYRDILIIDNYSGEIQTTALRIEGNSYIRGNALQIQMNKIGTDNGIKDIIAVDAPNLSSDTLSINNSISITHNSEDINDNLIGFNYGGSAGIHTSNMIMEVNTTNVNYSGNIRPIVYNDNTNPKTFGDLTVRVNDSGSGILTVCTILATSGTFMLNNLIAYYEGNGSAYIINDVNTQNVNVLIQGFNVDGFTDLNPIPNDYFSTPSASGMLNGSSVIYGLERTKINTALEVAGYEGGVTREPTIIFNDIGGNMEGRVVLSPNDLGNTFGMYYLNSLDFTSGRIIDYSKRFEEINIGQSNFYSDDVQEVNIYSAKRMLLSTYDYNDGRGTSIQSSFDSIDMRYSSFDGTDSYNNDITINEDNIQIYYDFNGNSSLLQIDETGFDFNGGNLLDVGTINPGGELTTFGGDLVVDGESMFKQNIELYDNVARESNAYLRAFVWKDINDNNAGFMGYASAANNDFYINNEVGNILMTSDLDLDGNNIIDVDTINPDGETTTFGGDLEAEYIGIDTLSTPTPTKLNIGNTNIFTDTSATSSILLTNQGGDYAVGNNTQAIVWSQQSSNGSTPSASISLESRDVSGGTSDLVFKTVGNATGETLRLGADGKIRMRTLPNNSTGLISGELYTQLASELGGTGTRKVVCQV